VRLTVERIVHHALDIARFSSTRQIATAGFRFNLPAKSGSSWIGVYRNLARGEVGLQLSSTKNSPGDYARQVIVEDWDMLKPEIGGSATLVDDNGKVAVRDVFNAGDLHDPEVRKKAFAWLAERLNTFVNVLRPRVRAAIADQAT
jgi:hypothetical protein